MNHSLFPPKGRRQVLKRGAALLAAATATGFPGRVFGTSPPVPEPATGRPQAGTPPQGADDAVRRTPGTLYLGLGPFLSPAAMLRAFRPMREHLSQALGQPVETYTARDLRALVGHARRQDYDVMLMPAHLARLSTTDWNYLPLAATLYSTTVLVVVVRPDGKVRAAADLKGGRVSAPDVLSNLWLDAVAWLRSEGMEPGRDYRFVAQPSGNSALYALERGDIDAAVVATTQMLDMPPETPRPRVLKELSPVMGPVYVIRASLPADERSRILAAFLSFEPNPSLPQTTSNTRLRPLANKDLEVVEGYAQEARRILATSP